MNAKIDFENISFDFSIITIIFLVAILMAVFYFIVLGISSSEIAFDCVEFENHIYPINLQSINLRESVLIACEGK